MQEKKITQIDWEQENQDTPKSTAPLRVAAYARVSTEKESQENSMEAQQKYFEEYITNHEGWTFVGVYADNGRSGLSYHKRLGFQNMLQDALDDKIDHIIVKSLSRFARNTVDALTVIHQLKAKGISIYFQKEDINTLDGAGEFMLTLMSSFAEEESRSISENIKWAKRHYFAQGKYAVPFSHFMGYQRGQNGELIVQEDEAKIVRYIYLLALQGYSSTHICKILMEQGLPTPFGTSEWHSSTVVSILSNEKYIGDARLQKTVTVDFLTKAKKENTGEAPQYYVENGHEAIISKAVWHEVQANWIAGFGKQPTLHPLGRKIVCGCCGGCFGLKVWHSTSTHDVVWECNRKKVGVSGCRNIHIYDYELQAAVKNALWVLTDRYMDVVNKCLTALSIEITRNHLRTTVRDGSFFDDLAVRFLIQEIRVSENGRIVFTFLDGSHYRYYLKQNTPKGQIGYATRRKSHARIVELYQLGCKPSEIARRLGISRNTVKSYLRRHKELL